MQKAVLSLGSNLGDRVNNLKNAIIEINKQIGFSIAISSFYVTEPWGKTDVPDYINIVAIIQTNLSARMLLQKCLAIEEKAGRVRMEKYGSRTLDIDILYYNNAVIDDDDLQVPHPRMFLRKFVLLPLMEIWPDFLDPLTGKTISQFLEQIDDSLFIKKIDI